ncbi:hypothetical protein CRENBAI_026126 [Crenichthys baileyi]|uniref:CAC1B n=1 Tax=Crenichthys baileyi TaxID=28760 RepID=A0AAV9S2I8_9TELE
MLVTCVLMNFCARYTAADHTAAVKTWQSSLWSLWLNACCHIRRHFTLSCCPIRCTFRGCPACDCGIKRDPLNAAEHLQGHCGLSSFHFLHSHPSPVSYRLLRRRKRRMSSSFPKSESTTSLLRSSGFSRRLAHPDHPAAHRVHHRTHHHQHLHPSRAGSSEDAPWSDDSETSARRPLCQPRHAESGHLVEPHRVQRSYSHRQPSHLEDDYSQELDARHRASRLHQKDRSKSSRSKPHHHPHHHHESPPAEPLIHQGDSRQDRRTSPTPSLPKISDEADFLFEQSERAVTGSTSTLSSDAPAASAPFRPASSRRGKKLGSASECDSSLHPIVKSVFGQEVKGSQYEYMAFIKTVT